MNYQIDDVDKKIISFLAENARMPFTEIAKKINVSAGTIHVRVKKMEDLGIIKGSSLIVDYERVGYNFVAYVGILISKTEKKDSVLEMLRQIPNVTVAHVVSGKFTILCQIRARNTAEARDIIFKIVDIKEVTQTESIISMEESINDKARLINKIFT